MPTLRSPQLNQSQLKVYCLTCCTGKQTYVDLGFYGIVTDVECPSEVNAYDGEGNRFTHADFWQRWKVRNGIWFLTMSLTYSHTVQDCDLMRFLGFTHKKVTTPLASAKCASCWTNMYCPWGSTIVGFSY